MSKNKKEQEPDHKHYIYGLKGKKFQEVMTEQVNGDNWKAGRSHHFYSYPKSSQTQDPDETVVVSITSHPTDNQPGNGLVKFIEGNNSKALPWSALKPDLKNKDFPESRARYLDTPIDENTFQTDIGKANVLLDFEIARRKRISRKGFYPLTRSQVKKGISAALSHPDEDYSHKVDLMLVMFEGDWKNYFKERKAAYQQLVATTDDDDDDEQLDDLVKNTEKLSIGSEE